MTHDQEPEVVAVWHAASAVGRHFEELLADGTVYAWTEPPLGEPTTPARTTPTTTPSATAPPSHARSA
ncbi:hypothetical protein ABZ918_33120 [Streptomyces viridosporus]|uniref:hypothetical protein n=1 Tax=Streptomyces viridosporus TaxID=67581 RepID=UPI00342D9D88